jgi:hypothetical protein
MTGSFDLILYEISILVIPAGAWVESVLIRCCTSIRLVPLCCRLCQRECLGNPAWSEGLACAEASCTGTGRGRTNCAPIQVH